MDNFLESLKSPKKNVQKLKSVNLRVTSGLTSGARLNFKLIGKSIKS